MCDLIVVIVLVTGHTPNRSFYPERLLKHVHRLLDVWIMCREHAKLEETTHAAVQRHIFLDRAILSHRDHTQKVTALLVPQEAQSGIFDLLCRLPILSRQFFLTKEQR